VANFVIIGQAVAEIWRLIKATIGPGFSGTVPIFNDVSRKNHSSPGTPICRPVFDLVSRICPDHPISAVVCLRYASVAIN